MDDRLQYVTMTRLVSPHLIHPHVYDQHVRQCQTKQRHLLLEDLLMRLSFRRIEALSIDYVKVTDVMKPESFGAASSRDGGVQDWESGAENVVEESTFPGALGAEDGDISEGRGEAL